MRTKQNRKIARNSAVNNDEQENNFFKSNTLQSFGIEEPSRHGIDLLAKNVKRNRI